MFIVCECCLFYRIIRIMRYDKIRIRTVPFLRRMTMTIKELKRLSRGDLLEMLLDLSKENDRLRKRLEIVNKELEDKKLRIENSGSLAEAALQLNGIFEAAQAACDQYTQNVRQRCEQMEAETKARCEQMLAQSKADGNDSYAWLKDLMNGETTGQD